ncbi:MAG: hypothetical protein UHW86_04895 [Spirochaetota bacterium]|nr:hypothetical protein [Spirochaetota bacterium]
MIVRPFFIRLLPIAFPVIPGSNIICAASQIAGLAFFISKLCKKKSISSANREKLYLVISQIDRDIFRDTNTIYDSIKKQLEKIAIESKTNFNIEILCVLPPASSGKDYQKKMAFFVQQLSENLSCKVHFIEKQFFYDENPQISANIVKEKVHTQIKELIGNSEFLFISEYGKIKFYSDLKDLLTTLH